MCKEETHEVLPQALHTVVLPGYMMACGSNRLQLPSSFYLDGSFVTLPKGLDRGSVLLLRPKPVWERVFWGSLICHLDLFQQGCAQL